MLAKCFLIFYDAKINSITGLSHASACTLHSLILDSNVLRKTSSAAPRACLCSMLIWRQEHTLFLYLPVLFARSAPRPSTAKRIATEEVARVCVRWWSTRAHARRRASRTSHLSGRDTNWSWTTRLLVRLPSHRTHPILLHMRWPKLLLLLLLWVYRPCLLLVLV